MAQQSICGMTALVTGGARRIGRAIAHALASEGVNVAVHYRTAEAEAQALCRQLRQGGVKAWAVHADLAQPEECESLVAHTREQAGGLDLLVNNASIFAADSLAAMSRERLLEMMAINAWAPLALGRSFARQVGQGRIVNLLDSRIRGCDLEHAAYIVSKHALAHLTRMMALQFAPGITVNAVAPGAILPPAGKDQQHLEQLAAALPLRRHGDPQDVAEAVVFLLKSAYITGQIIYVDGGRHLGEGGDGSHPD